MLTIFGTAREVEKNLENFIIYHYFFLTLATVATLYILADAGQSIKHTPFHSSIGSRSVIVHGVG